MYSGELEHAMLGSFNRIYAQLLTYVFEITFAPVLVLA